MKKKSDPRHKMRTVLVKSLFQASFIKPQPAALNPTYSQIMTNLKRIDKLIAQNAQSWPIEQISPIDLATLRLAIWELIFKKKKEPYKVIIDEAVEIAKEYGTQASPSFVNGVLGSIVKSNLKNTLDS